MAVTIRIWAYPDSYLVINGQRVRPGSYQVDKGSSVSFMVNAKNHGTAGPAWLGIRNRDTGKILKWRSYSVKEEQVFYYSSTITVDDDMNLELVGGQLTNEGRIIQHSYGTWSITVKEEKVPPSGVLSMTLSKTTVKPKESIRVSWSLKNSSTSPYYFKIDFESNGAPVKTIDLGQVAGGQTKSGSFTYYAPGSPGTYRFEAIAYVRPSRYANWLDFDSVTRQITVKEEEVPSVPPIAKIQRIKVNGESVSDGGYKTISTASITVSVRVSNVGGKGDISAHIDIKDSRGNGVYSKTKTESMYAGETEDITFSTTLPGADTYRVTVSVGH